MNINNITPADITSEPNVEVIMAIAVDLWREKGRTTEEIKAVLYSTDKAVREAFLNPALKVYMMLQEKFGK